MITDQSINKSQTNKERKSEEPNCTRLANGCRLRGKGFRIGCAKVKVFSTLQSHGAIE